MLCTVDLSQHKDVSLQLEKVGPGPYCEMSLNSQVRDRITVAAGTKASLSFLDCPSEDVRLTATQVLSKRSNGQRSHFMTSEYAFLSFGYTRLKSSCRQALTLENNDLEA